MFYGFIVLRFDFKPNDDLVEMFQNDIEGKYALHGKGNQHGADTQKERHKTQQLSSNVLQYEHHLHRIHTEG